MNDPVSTGKLQRVLTNLLDNAEGHHGEMTLASTLGSGSSVGFRLPLPAGASAPPSP